MDVDEQVERSGCLGDVKVLFIFAIALIGLWSGWAVKDRKASAHEALIRSFEISKEISPCRMASLSYYYYVVISI